MTTHITENHRQQLLADSVIFIPSFIDEDLCSSTCEWLEDNESSIIDSYQSDRRGLACNTYNGKPSIKYFEHPLGVNADLFGKFLTSDLFRTAEFLLGESVFLRSMEVHSRFPGSDTIPLHQDNAYYGLSRGSALTFYIPINSQSPLNGGLRYLATEHGEAYDHCLSDASGFSLTIKDNLTPNLSPLRDYVYKPGDCSVHSPYSRHYADTTPISASRAWVVRFSLYSNTDWVVDGHQEWYENMIRLNRSSNS